MSQGMSREKKVSDTKLRLARQFRQEATSSEEALWEALRGRKLSGLKFRRQQVVCGFIADFYCEERNLAVEVDGGYHAEPVAVAKDRERDEAFGAAGVKVLRVSAEDVLRSLPVVLQKIAQVP
jgi:very-short-patch-repair endonuclease